MPDILASDYLPAGLQRMWSFPAEWQAEMDQQLAHITFEREKKWIISNGFQGLKGEMKTPCVLATSARAGLDTPAQPPCPRAAARDANGVLDRERQPRFPAPLQQLAPILTNRLQAFLLASQLSINWFTKSEKSWFEPTSCLLTS